MFRVWLESESYTWQAYAETFEKGKEMIAEYWNRHKICYPMTSKELEERYGFNCEECVPNQTKVSTRSR